MPCLYPVKLHTCFQEKHGCCSPFLLSARCRLPNAAPAAARQMAMAFVSTCGEHGVALELRGAECGLLLQMRTCGMPPELQAV